VADPVTYFSSLAKQLGLNVDQFKSDFTSKKVNDAINADIAEGNKLKVTGTPSFFLNGKQIELQILVDPVNNTPTLEKFSAILDAAIKEQADKKGSSSATTNSADKSSDDSSGDSQNTSGQ
jgi:protein-disulfide isomerase